MKRLLSIASLILVAGFLSACASLNPAYRIGTVASVSDGDLQVCLDPHASPPVAAEEVQLVRRQQMGNPKFAPTFRDRRVGTARIGADVSGRCVAATLVQGKTRRHDHVYPELGDAQPR